MSKPIVIQVENGMTAREVARECVEVANATKRPVCALVALYVAAESGDSVDDVIDRATSALNAERAKEDSVAVERQP